MNKKKINALIVFIIGILVSAFSIALVIRKVEFSKLIETAAGVSGAGFFLLTLSLILTFFTYLIRALFWNLIIRFGAGYKLSYKNSLSVLSIGLLGNNILPAKSGEIIRAVVLSKKTNLKKSFIFGSIFLERFFDLIVLLFFLFLSSLIIKFPENIKKIEIVSFIIIGAIIFFLLIFFLFYQKILSHKVFKFSKFLSKFCAWLLEKINSFKKPIVEILNLKRAVISFLLSLTIWISSTISLYLVGRTLNIQLSLIFYFLIIAVINLGAIIPSAPGAIGLYQYLCIISLSIFGIDENVALVFSLLSHIIWYFSSSLLGVFFLFFENISLLKILSEEKRNIDYNKGE